MTDQTPSDAPDAPAADHSAPATPVETAGPSTSSGTFGTTRGSGLARGKRPSHTAASAAPAAPGNYQPTAVEVIKPQREYKNPFGSVNEVTEPSHQPTAVPPSPPSEPVAAAPAVVPEPPAEEIKAELNILPPAEVKRTAMSWEKPQAENKEPAPGYPPRRSHDDRRHERRDRASGPVGDHDRREERRDDRPHFRTDAQRARGPAAAPQVAESKPTGFFAWLKSLFGGKKPAPAETQGRSSEGDSSREEGHRHHRRHRGGRGRHGGRFEGRSDGRSEGRSDGRSEGRSERHHDDHAGQQPRPEGRSEGGERRGEYPQDGGQRRRRHRGGRGRHRNGPHSEGQQGGGFI